MASQPENISLPQPEAPTRQRLFVWVDSTVDLDQPDAQAIARAQQNLLNLQKPDGHWCGELLVDVTLAADVILFMHWRGQVDFEKQSKCIKHILDRQQPDGGWNLYKGGPSELNATLTAYVALKLAGFTSEEVEMRKAQSVILRLGGVPKANTYNKLYFALLGLYPWERLPIIPVEMILLPNWLYFNIYEMSSWSRAMVVPLGIINHFKPTRFLPPEKQIHELYPYGSEYQAFRMPWEPRFLSWQNFFLGWDAILKFVDKLPFKPFRGRALKKAEAWLTDRVGDGSEGLGAIFPSMMYTIIGLKALGYSDDHPLVQKATKDFEGLEVNDEANHDFRIQPCLSPVWDTGITAVALAESGVPADHESLQKAAAWLLRQEVRFRGDWAVKNPHPENSGWAFEYANKYYPDVDDTFKVLMALSLIKTPDEPAKQKVMKRALNWAISFQCKNGGWAAFDKDITKSWLQDVPFADHNAILDPPCSDITARALEVFARMGLDPQRPFIQKAIRFIRETQYEDGSWLGRWGVNYIYGTWLVLRGLSFIQEDMNQDWVLRGRDWLESCQNDDGGWGETPASYDNPHLKGQGPSTPSQTAWALMGVLACGDPRRSSVRRGIAYLCHTQNPDGSWTEDYITGTGFPKVFYLKYDMYRNNWPLLALSEYRRLRLKITST